MIQIYEKGADAMNAASILKCDGVVTTGCNVLVKCWNCYKNKKDIQLKEYVSSKLKAM